MNYGDYSWLAGWNGYELRAINKNQFATAGHNHDSRYYTESEIDSKLDGKSNVGHTHDYLPTAGGTMNGTITFSDSSHGKIYSGPTDNVNGPGGDLNNIVIESWNGLSFTTGCPNQTYTGKTAVGIDCREGVVKAARFDGTLTGTAATLGGGGNPYAPMTFNWSGKDGQPTWLWGGEDGTNMYVYNPGNFKVNWAQSAANGVYANGFDGSGGGYIRFCNGAQICWGRTNCSGKDTTINFSAAFSNSSYSVSTMPFYSSLANTYWNVKEGSINADFECNPLAAPYLEDIIKKIKDGGKPDNQKVYVDEACFACDDTVSSFKTDEGKEITMTVVDDKVLKERAY